MKPLTGQSARHSRCALVRGRPLPVSKRVASPLLNRFPFPRYSSSFTLFFLGILLVGCLFAPSAFAVTCTSVAGGGNWDAPATWTGCAGGNGTPANTPGLADTAIIAGPVIANVTTPVVAITVNASQALTINSGVTLTATTITINASATVANNGAVTVSSLTGSGTGTWTQGSNAVFIYSGATITPRLNASASGNTVTYAGSGQTVKQGSVPTCSSPCYYNLTIASSGGTTTATGTYTVSNNLTINRPVPPPLAAQAPASAARRP